MSNRLKLRQEKSVCLDMIKTGLDMNNTSFEVIKRRYIIGAKCFITLNTVKEMWSQYNIAANFCRLFLGIFTNIDEPPSNLLFCF